MEKSANIRLHMRNRGTNAEAGVRLQTSRKSRTARTGKPAINDIGQREVEPVRKAELLQRVVDPFMTIHANAVAFAGHRHRLTSLRVELDMEIFGAETPVRLFARKPEQARAIERRRFEIAAFEGDIDIAER